jgi:hypothetical protein
MSERFGHCFNCHGIGSIRLWANAEAKQKFYALGPKSRRLYKPKPEDFIREECASCGGTGEDGSALTYCENENRQEPEYLSSNMQTKDGRLN